MPDSSMEQPSIPELDLQDELQSFSLHHKLDGNHELSDAQWLQQNRKQFGMSQSNIVSYLEITTWQNVNPGRIAEIETGQRCIPTLWREKLERLFNQLQQPTTKRRNWREFIQASEGKSWNSI